MRARARIQFNRNENDAIFVTWQTAGVHLKWNLWINQRCQERIVCVMAMPYIIKHAECISSLSSCGCFSVVILIFFWRQHVCCFFSHFISFHYNPFHRQTTTSSEMPFKGTEQRDERGKKKKTIRCFFCGRYQFFGCSFSVSDAVYCVLQRIKCCYYYYYFVAVFGCQFFFFIFSLNAYRIREMLT